ncbi:MAG: hypothetical protein ACOC4I_06780 [Spirochaetota bacterium]
MTNTDAVCIACLDAGGALSRIDIEHIALAAYELAPAQFCWNHFPDRVDLRKVQYALKDEMRAPHPRLSGTMKDGYQLTPSGLEWSQAVVESRRNQGAGEPQGVSSKIDAERWRLRSSEAFQKFTASAVDTITRKDFESLVRINDYFPEGLRIQRIAKIENIVKGDAELARFWASMKSIFGGADNA